MVEELNLAGIEARQNVPVDIGFRLAGRHVVDAVLAETLARPLAGVSVAADAAQLVSLEQGGATREGLPYTGWETSLMGEDRGANRVRSMILPLQSIINPLGLIGGLKLVVANSGWGAAILAVQGLVTDALLVLAVLAIRKRFRPR